MARKKTAQALTHMGALFSVVLWGSLALARDIESKGQEMNIYVAPGEPTEVQFPGKITGGYGRKNSPLTIERKDSSLVMFAGESLSPNGEAIIVRLEDGRSYSVRITRATPDSPRDAIVSVKDGRGALLADGDEEEPAYREKGFEYAPPTQVSGLMREMVLAAEFGKEKIPGYRASDQYRGQVVLDDGTVTATIDRIYIGPNLWGYVLDAQNRIDVTQKLNPAAFRLDGTRAVSIRNWELAPRPMNIEQQLSGGDKTKVYIITRARNAQ